MEFTVTKKIDIDIDLGMEYIGNKIDCLMEDVDADLDNTIPDWSDDSDYVALMREQYTPEWKQIKKTFYEAVKADFNDIIDKYIETLMEG